MKKAVVSVYGVVSGFVVGRYRFACSGPAKENIISYEELDEKMDNIMQTTTREPQQHTVDPKQNHLSSIVHDKVIWSVRIIAFSPKNLIALGYASKRKTKATELWLPGGKCEPGETTRQAAVRELYEETGIVISSTQLQMLGVRKHTSPRGENCKLAYFKVHVPKQPMHKNDEFQSLHWFSMKELNRVRFLNWHVDEAFKILRDKEVSNLIPAITTKSTKISPRYSKNAAKLTELNHFCDARLGMGPKPPHAHCHNKKCGAVFRVGYNTCPCCIKPLSETKTLDYRVALIRCRHCLHKFDTTDVPNNCPQCRTSLNPLDDGWDTPVQIPKPSNRSKRKCSSNTTSQKRKLKRHVFSTGTSNKRKQTANNIQQFGRSKTARWQRGWNTIAKKKIQEPIFGLDSLVDPEFLQCNFSERHRREGLTLVVLIEYSRCPSCKQSGIGTSTILKPDLHTNTDTPTASSDHLKLNSANSQITDTPTASSDHLEQNSAKSSI